jgi:hypothetical protein
MKNFMQSATSMQQRKQHTDLIEIKDAGHGLVEPDGVPCTLSKLFSIRTSEKWCCYAKPLLQAIALIQCGACAINQVDSGDDITPLIRAADLYRAPGSLEKCHKIVRLQQLVAEFSE